MAGPTADALLVGGWLRSRLAREVLLRHEEAGDDRAGRRRRREVAPPPSEPTSASDLLSGELDTFGRDPIYETSVAAAR